MKKKSHEGFVYEPKEILKTPPPLKVTNCYKSLWEKYSYPRAYMTQLVSSPDGSAMSRNPGHPPLSQSKENNLVRNHHQEEMIQNLVIQLRYIADSMNYREAQEDLQQEVRDALVHFTLSVFRRIQVLLRSFWNNRLL
ncbi:LOW QUALITY PROTEIN: peroxisomal testis-specific protein 1 [Urocitellus parryii]